MGIRGFKFFKYLQVIADLGIIKNCIVNKISGFAYIGLELLDRYLSLQISADKLINKYILIGKTSCLHYELKY